jgi:hypothetical protein
VTPAQSDLFSQPQPEPQAAEPTADKWQPVIDPAKRPGPFDCSMMKRHATARNIPREFDEQERRAQASEERKRNKTGHQAGRSSRQIAADIATDQGEAESTPAIDAEDI